MRKGNYAAIIEHGEILLVKKKETWILPGGKPISNSNETDLDCLCREVIEELSGTKLKNIQYYKQVDGITPHTKDTLRARIYFADIDGELGKPSNEISEYKWIKDTINYNLSDLTLKIINSLREDKYL